MSGFTEDSTPSILGGGAPGVALQLLGGGANSTSGTGMVGGSLRERTRLQLRNAFKTNLVSTGRSINTWTMQPDPNGKVVGGIVIDGLFIPTTNPQSSTIILQPPFYNEYGDIIKTLPGIKPYGINPNVLDMTRPLKIELKGNTFEIEVYAHTPGGETQEYSFYPGVTITLYNNQNLYSDPPKPRAVCGPFRAALSAGDVLGRDQQSVASANQVTSVNSAKNPGWRRLAGAASNLDSGKVTILNGKAYITGTGPGQTPLQSGNPKFVYDSSDYIKFKRLFAGNQTYNDKSFGGPSLDRIGGSGEFAALNRVRH